MAGDMQNVLRPTEPARRLRAESKRLRNKALQLTLQTGYLLQSRRTEYSVGGRSPTKPQMGVKRAFSLTENLHKKNGQLARRRFINNYHLQGTSKGGQLRITCEKLEQSYLEIRGHLNLNHVAAVIYYDQLRTRNHGVKSLCVRHRKDRIFFPPYD